jgi:gliding motility-associated-like protein
MRYLLLLISITTFFLESLASGGCTGTTIPCSDANPFCTTNTYDFPNETSTCTPSGPNYGCLSTTPNPVWYYMEVDQSGSFQISLSQSSGTNGTGSGMDVDFALYGPFASLSAGCSTVNGGVSPIQCSYSTSATETIGIGLPGGSPTTTPASAIAGQVYIVLITNYNGGSGYIMFNQTGGTGVADCAIVSPCNISAVTATPTTCNSGNVYNVSGTVTFTDAPTTGTLTVASSGGGSQVFNAPFTSPLNYTISAITATGISETITATFSANTGCMNSVTYTAPSLPIVNAGIDQAVCNGVAVTLNGSGANTYSWDNGVVNGVSFTPGSTMTYTLTGTNVSGCTGTDQVLVTVNPIPAVNAGVDQAVCESVSVTLSGSGASTYSWDNAISDGVSFTPSVGTILYTVTSSSDQVSVTVNPLPIVSAGIYSTECSDAPGIALAGSPAGGTFSGTGVTGNNFAPSAGTQTITYNYTDGFGCSGSANTTITINPIPVVSAGVYSPACSNGANVTLIGSPVGGAFGGVGVTGTLFNPASGTQTITYDYTDGNGCSNSASSTITVNTAPVVNAGSFGPLCVNDAAIALVGSPTGGTYSGTGVSSNMFSPASGSQTINYVYTDLNNCTNSATTFIQVNNLPTINGGSDVNVCSGTGVTLSGNGGVSYTWNNGGIDGQQFTPSTGSTMFTVTGTDANGCVNTDNVMVNVLPNPDAQVMADSVIGNPGLHVTFDNLSTNSSSYNWNFGNGSNYSVSNLNSQSTTYDAVGSYIMILTASNGICSDTAQIQIDIIPFPTPTVHVPNVFTPNNDGANDVFIIETTNATSFEAVILNRWGNVVHEINTVNGSWDGLVNGKQADDGVYFFKYTVTGINNEQITGHGNLTLIR